MDEAAVGVAGVPIRELVGVVEDLLTHAASRGEAHFHWFRPGKAETDAGVLESALGHAPVEVVDVAKWEVPEARRQRIVAAVIRDPQRALEVDAQRRLGVDLREAEDQGIFS